jgi:hypothetical protein
MWFGPDPLPAPPPLASIVDRIPGGRLLLVFLLVSGASVLLGNLVIALLSLPTNPDTVSYRLPRIYWYLSSGTLGHFAPDIDKRLVFYPFDGVLLQMPIVQYRWPGQLFHIGTLAAWVLAGLTCYRLSREMGLSRTAATVVAWLVCLTPGVLVQALSTNDEILAALILLIGLHFLLRFVRSRAVPDAALAMLAAGLSSGTKLHVVFFVPWVLAALLWFLLTPAARAWGSGVLRDVRLWRATPFAAMAAVLAAAFLWSNWNASGHLMDPAFTRSIMNEPFNWLVGVQNLVLHTVQMVLGPIPDLYTSGLMSKRERVYSEFNALFRPLFSWVRQEAPYTAGYRFVGPSQTNAYLVTEPTIGIGFSYVLVVVGLAASIARRDWLGILAGSAFFMWFVTHALSSKYIEGFSVYLAYAFIVCSPAIASFMVKGSSSGRRRLLVLLVVVAAHSVFAATLLRFGGVRNLNYVREAAAWPLRSKVDPGITAAFRSSGGARFVENHPAIPYWALMDTYKAGRYSVTASRNPDPDVLTVVACQQNTAWHCAPLAVPRKPLPGLALLGEFNSAFGAEWAFGAGAGIERRPRYRSGFLVFQFETGSDGAEEWLAIRHVWGFDPSEKLEFQYALMGGEGPVAVSEWGSDSQRRLSKLGKLAGATLRIEVRFAGEPGTLAALSYPLGSPQLFRIDN